MFLFIFVFRFITTNESDKVMKVSNDLLKRSLFYYYNNVQKKKIVDAFNREQQNVQQCTSSSKLRLIVFNYESASVV